MANFVKVPGVRYLAWRGASLYFRRGVPQYARPYFGNRSEVQVSFGPCTLADARYRLAREIGAFEHTLHIAKRASANAAGQSIILRLPSNVEIDEAVRAWLAARLETAKSSLSVGADAEAALIDLERQREDVKAGAALTSNEFALTTEWIAEHLISENGWDIHLGTPEHGRLLRMVSRGQREVATRLRQEIEGDPVKVEDDSFSPEQYRLDIERQRLRQRELSADVRLVDMFEGYVAEQKPKRSTIRAWRRQIDRLVAFLGHDNARNITAADILRWKEHLLATPNEKGKKLTARTVKDTYLAAVKSVLGWAFENGHLSMNPASKVRVRVPRAVRVRDPGYSNDEAKAILAAADLPPRSKVSPQSAFAYRWIAWLCAYSGARVNEITQLRKQDVLQIEGHWVILITPEAGTVKGNSHRYVPVHSAVTARGFIDEIAGKPDGPLFFDLSRRKTGSDENPQPKKVGERIAKWVREDVGITDPILQPNHAWRHRFKSLARKHRMDPEIRDVIQGHTPRTEGEGYGTREHIELMVEEIERLP